MYAMTLGSFGLFALVRWPSHNYFGHFATKIEIYQEKVKYWRLPLISFRSWGWANLNLGKKSCKFFDFNQLAIFVWNEPFPALVCDLTFQEVFHEFLCRTLDDAIYLKVTGNYYIKQGFTTETFASLILTFSVWKVSRKYNKRYLFI